MEQAVEQNYDDILWYFVYRVRNRAAAEDLTQETFYRFLRYSAKSFKEYCKTHDTIPFGIDFIEVQYSGDWTLTFPEN